MELYPPHVHVVNFGLRWEKEACISSPNYGENFSKPRKLNKILSIPLLIDNQIAIIDP